MGNKMRLVSSTNSMKGDKIIDADPTLQTPIGYWVQDHRAYSLVDANHNPCILEKLSLELIRVTWYITTQVVLQ
jgi:hypothetical protein